MTEYRVDCRKCTNLAVGDNGGIYAAGQVNAVSLTDAAVFGGA